MRMMLWALQSPINIGMILRTAEIYGVEVGIFDRFGLSTDPDAMSTMSDFACGAVQRRPPTLILGPEDARGFGTGRRVATAITGDAVSIHDFDFRSDDVVFVGNEYDGLPDTLLAEADARVTIPMPAGYLPKPPSASPIDPTRGGHTCNAGTPNLNVAVASAILMFVWHSRTGPPAGPSWSLRAQHGDSR